MRVELLYFDGCPNWKGADKRLREAMRTVGRNDIAVLRRRVNTPAEAEAVRFPVPPRSELTARIRSPRVTNSSVSLAGSTARQKG